MILKKKHVLSSSEIEKILGSRTEIKRHVDAGYLFPLGRGYYYSNSTDPFSAMVIAANRYYPRAVISNLTALVIHKLSDESLNEIDVDITRQEKLKNRLLRVHRVSPNRMIGISKLKFLEESIKIYDLERTLCEAYKIDSGGSIFFKAIKRYLKHYTPDFKKIGEYDKKLKTKVLIHLRQELADA